MASRASRACERISLIGGYLFGAIAAPAVALVFLALLTLILGMFVLFLIFLPAAVSLVAGVSSAESTRRAYLQQGRVPLRAFAGCLFAGLGLAWSVPYINAVFAHADAGLPLSIEVAYIGCSLHTGMLWGGVVGQEAAGWGARGERSVVAYPLWGYIVGGIAAAVFTFLSTISALAGGWVGVLEWTSLELVVVFLSVILVSRLLAPGNQRQG